MALQPWAELVGQAIRQQSQARHRRALTSPDRLPLQVAEAAEQLERLASVGQAVEVPGGSMLALRPMGPPTPAAAAVHATAVQLMAAQVWLS
jgi:hypothetical protein